MTPLAGTTLNTGSPGSAWKLKKAGTLELFSRYTTCGRRMRGGGAGLGVLAAAATT